MSQKRNNKCNCGSGKKYKKCCQIKEYEENKKLKEERREEWLKEYRDRKANPDKYKGVDIETLIRLASII
jgi:hypothetical protein